MKSLVFLIRGIYENEMSGAASEKSVQEHGFPERVEGKKSRELDASALTRVAGKVSYMLVWIHTIHPNSNLFNKDLHEQELFGVSQGVARFAWWR